MAASLDFDASRDPVALEVALGLVTGDVYFLQNVDSSARLRLRAAVAKPLASARSHFIEQGADLTVQADSSVPSWCWTDSVDGCAVILTEAP